MYNMYNIPQIAQKTGEDEDDSKIRLTMAKITLQWWINKNKNTPDIDYSERIQFAKFNLERITGKKVKMGT